MKSLVYILSMRLSLLFILELTIIFYPWGKHILTRIITTIFLDASKPEVEFLMPVKVVYFAYHLIR